jgi:protein SCO1/2
MRWLAVTAIALACSACGGGTPEPEFRGTVLTPPTAAPGFTLTDRRGPLTFVPKRDGYTVVTFLYTHCPDVCPVVAGNLNQALRTDVAKRARLRVLAVSVDPKGDTPAAVAKYVRAHRLLPAFRYLTGSRAALEPVWRDYHIAVLPGANGVVAHQLFEFLVDPDGKQRLLYDDKLTTADLVHDLRLLTAGDA